MQDTQDKEKYMLIFSIGPVQTFIAQARKTRDLWIGSYLVAKLMESALKGIGDDKRIFPATVNVEKVPDIPNKYIAVYGTVEEAQKAAKNSTDKIKGAWKEICDKVYEEIIEKHGDKTTEDIWTRQTRFESLIDVYWVIVERGVGQIYNKWLGDAEAAFAARKRLRDFEPSNEPGEKSTISGEREVLRRDTDRIQAKPGENELSKVRREIRTFWKGVAQQSSKTDVDLDQDGSERLDAIDTIKRFAMRARAVHFEQPFPSTSSIAAASYVEQLLQQPVPEKVFEQWEPATRDMSRLGKVDISKEFPFLHKLVDGKEVDEKQSKKQWLLGLDGDLYYEATFTADRLKKSYPRVLEHEREGQAKQGRDGLGKLLKATDTLGIVRPTPYYAVVQMDGDQLGLLLSGVKTREEHTEISKTLSRFSGAGNVEQDQKSTVNAESVGNGAEDQKSGGNGAEDQKSAIEIVQKKYPARLVYAGGDDVLAFAPCARDLGVGQRNKESEIETVLDLADELQKSYCEMMKKVVVVDEGKPGISASTGIVIAHHYVPLSYVMRNVREAEQHAKKRYGRNALVVTILRRSGEQTSVGCHWSYPNVQDESKPLQPLQIFKRFYHLFKDDLLSPKAVHNLLEEAPILVGLERKAQESEVRRVLFRQYDTHEHAKLKKISKEEARDQVKKDVAGEAQALIEIARLMDEEHAGKDLASELHADRLRYGIVEVLGWLLVMAFFARKDQE